MSLIGRNGTGKKKSPGKVKNRDNTMEVEKKRLGDSEHLWGI